MEAADVEETAETSAGVLLALLPQPVNLFDVMASVYPVKFSPLLRG
jgi:hypothetical protein